MQWSKTSIYPMIILCIKQWLQYSCTWNNSVRTSPITVSNIKTSRLIRFGEIITVYSENHTLHENTLCGQNAEIFNIKECRIYSNLGVYKSRVTKFWTMAPDICGYSVWNVLHVTLLSPRNLDDFRNHLPSTVNKYRRTPISAGNTFQDLTRLRGTAGNTERDITWHSCNIHIYGTFNW